MLRTSNRNLCRKRISFESLESRLLLASDWQNPINPHDVDAVPSPHPITAADALMVVNELAMRQVSDPTTGALPTMEPGTVVEPPYVDVNGDSFVTAQDALQVINLLIGQGNVDPPGTSTSTSNPSSDPFSTSNVMAGSDASHNGVDHDTLVNSTTSLNQTHPDVATAPLGASVIVWQSYHQDDSSWGVFGQRYDADGNKVGNEFQVNTTTRYSQEKPAVAVDDSGGFFVVWQSLEQDGSSWGVYGQYFDSEGNRVGGEVLLNETTRGLQYNPDVAYLPSANGEGGNSFVAVWEGWGAGEYDEILASTVSVNGTNVSVSSERLVNSFYARGNQSNPSVDSWDNGYVVAWDGKGPDEIIGTFMQRFTLTDAPIDSSHVHVNIDNIGPQSFPAVTANGDNIFVAWEESHSDVLARRFVVDSANNITADDNVIVVNQTTRGYQARPSIDHLADGGVVAAWFGKGQGDHFGTFSRTFDMNGNATSDEILANIDVRAGQIKPAVAAANDGYIVAWQGLGEGDNVGIFARFENTGVVGNFLVSTDGDQTVDEGDTVTINTTIQDLDGLSDNPTFSFAQGPELATIDSQTGQVQWVTTEADGPGSQTFVIVATEGDFSAMTEVTVTVREVNQAPVITPIADSQVDVGAMFSLGINVSDADLPANTLDVTATQGDGSALPSWLSFDANSRMLNGTPGQNDVGQTSILITASDGIDSATENFNILVDDMDDAPNAVDSTFRINENSNNGTAVGGVLASDPDVGDTLAYSIQSGNGAGTYAIDSATGAITVADSTQLMAGNTDVLVVSVTDGVTTPATANITINVTANDAIVRYSLTAEDGNGNTLSALTSGQSFELVLSTQDLRPPQDTNGDGINDLPAGVFSAFADITYMADFATVTGTIQHSSTYPAGASGNSTTPGLLDEVGGTDGVVALGGDVFEVARIPMQLSMLPNGTSVSFATDPIEDLVQRATLVFLSNDRVAFDLIEFGTLTLVVGGDAIALGSSSSDPANNDPMGDQVGQSAMAMATTTDAASTQLTQLATYDAAYAEDDDSRWWDDTVNHEEETDWLLDRR